MKALMSEQPWGSGHDKGNVTGAGYLWESKNTEFVWELRKMGFCEGSQL